MSSKNPFAVLGVPNNSSKEVCRKAYRKLSKLHHPDRGGSEEKFKEIVNAWEIINSGKPIKFQASTVAKDPFKNRKSNAYHRSLFDIVFG